MKTFTLKDRSEVDIRVAQEIKNHQDLMYQTGQQIQALAREVATFSAKHEKVVSQADSDRKQVLIAFENLQKEVLSKLDKFFQRIGDLECRYIDLHDSLDCQMDGFRSTYVTKNESYKDSALQLENLVALQKLVGINSTYVEKALEELKSHINDQIVDVRKGIPSIEEFKPLKQVMEDHFTAFKIDFVGLVKEIALLKKSSAYDQKKFENIYTLIERLKGEKQ